MAVVIANHPPHMIAPRIARSNTLLNGWPAAHATT